MDLRSNGTLFTSSNLRGSIREMPTFALAALYTFEDADAGGTGNAWGKAQVNDISGNDRHATFLSGSSAFDRGNYIGTSTSPNDGLVMISPFAIGAFGTIVGVIRQTVGDGPAEGRPTYWKSSASLGANTGVAGAVTVGAAIRENLVDDLSADVRRKIEIFSPAQAGGPASDQTRTQTIRYNPQSFLAFLMTWNNSSNRIQFMSAGVTDNFTTAGMADSIPLGTSPTHAFGIIKQGTDLVEGDYGLFAVYGANFSVERDQEFLLNCALAHCATKNIIAV